MPQANKPKIDIYGGRDPQDIPAYRLADAAKYLNIAQPPLDRGSRDTITTLKTVAGFSLQKNSGRTPNFQASEAVCSKK